MPAAVAAASLLSHPPLADTLRRRYYAYAAYAMLSPPLRLFRRHFDYAIIMLRCQQINTKNDIRQTQNTGIAAKASFSDITPCFCHKLDYACFSFSLLLFTPAIYLCHIMLLIFFSPARFDADAMPAVLRRFD